MVRAQAGDNRRMVRERFPSNGVPNFELFFSDIPFPFFWNWDSTYSHSSHLRCVNLFLQKQVIGKNIRISFV